MSESKVPVVRAYSMANYPGEKAIIMLNVRISTPSSAQPDAAKQEAMRERASFACPREASDTVLEAIMQGSISGRKGDRIEGWRRRYG